MVLKKTVAVILMIGFVFVMTAQNLQVRGNLRKHVYTLATDSMLGRRAGSLQGQKAAYYIMSQFSEIGIEKAVSDENGDTYFKRFIFRGNQYANIIGALPGTDEALKNEIVIIGAHYDHIGFKQFMGDTLVYNGADDNASGVAVLIELARELKRHEDRLKRTIVFVAFDAEEMGLLGSRVILSTFNEQPVKLMINLDMVGWYFGGALHVRGAATFRDGYVLVNSFEPPEKLNVRIPRYDMNKEFASDHYYFRKAGIPALYLTTGLKSPYHKTGDDAEKLDYEGMEMITEYLNGLTMAIGNLEKIRPTK